MRTRIVALERLPGGPAHRAVVDRLAGIVVPDRVVPGYATVELDRAGSDLVAALGSSGDHVTADLPDDTALGARCRLLSIADGSEIVLLEPATEGRLAAALARNGEGVVAVYLFVDPAARVRLEEAGIVLGTQLTGPFGPERLVVDGRRDGWLVIVARPEPAG